MKSIIAIIALLSSIVSSQKTLVRRNVCFDSTRYVASTFKAPKSGTITGIELVYRSGGQTCRRGGFLTKWGCDNEKFMVQMVKKGGSTMYPVSNTKGVSGIRAAKCSKECKVHWYQLAGKNTKSSSITLSAKNYNVKKNEQFSLQNGEGCCQIHPGDNKGKTCADVYFNYINPKGRACATRARQRTIISGKIYTCAGAFSGGGVLGAKAAALCAGNYEICPSAKRTKQLGLTANMCSTKVATNANQFFATKETSMGWLKCYSDNPNSRNYDHDKNGVADVNDVFGCSKAPAVSGRLYKTNCGGSLTTAIGNGDWKGWKYTGDGKGLDEGNNMKLTTAANGGVMCCRKPPRKAAVADFIDEDVTDDVDMAVDEDEVVDQFDDAEDMDMAIDEDEVVDEIDGDVVEDMDMAINEDVVVDDVIDDVVDDAFDVDENAENVLFEEPMYNEVEEDVINEVDDDMMGNPDDALENQPVDEEPLFDEEPVDFNDDDEDVFDDEFDEDAIYDDDDIDDDNMYYEPQQHHHHKYKPSVPTMPTETTLFNSGNLFIVVLIILNMMAVSVTTYCCLRVRGMNAVSHKTVETMAEY